MSSRENCNSRSPICFFDRKPSLQFCWFTSARMLLQLPQLYNAINSIGLSCPTGHIEISNITINTAFLKIRVKSAARLSNKRVIFKALKFCIASALTD